MFTILGASGFVGSALATYLKQRGEKVFAPPREYLPESGKHLGYLVYCVGLTADFRTRPLETINAHVCLLTQFLTKCTYDSFVYLSSTRIYAGASTTSEGAMLHVQPRNPDHLYNLTKITGEAACHSLAGTKARVVRLSNVIGYDPKSPNFLFSLIRDAVEKRTIHLGTSPASVKDYILLDDVLPLICAIALSQHDTVYNVASGINRSNQSIADTISRLSGCQVIWNLDAPTISFQGIIIDRIRKEFGFSPSSLDDYLETQIKNNYKGHV